MEKNINEEVKLPVEITLENNPYANGNGRAIIERLFRESREAKENALKEYQQNPELRQLYAGIKKKQKEADAE